MHRVQYADIDTAITPANTGSRKPCCGLYLRALVSKKKRRFIDGSVDLDLTYVTNTVIAMGYPAVGLEALYRNPAETVRAFLEGRHGGHYRIWNLVSEREYGPGTFAGQIERFAWADHTPPPFAIVSRIGAVQDRLHLEPPHYDHTVQVLPLCESMASWLGADSANVAVVHCKAGKGRTGTVIACYLLHSRVCLTADEAVHVFGTRRTRNGRGITIPSQYRWVRYYGFQIAALRAARTASRSRRPSAVGAASPPSALSPPPTLPSVAAGGAASAPASATGVILRVDDEAGHAVGRTGILWAGAGMVRRGGGGGAASTAAAPSGPPRQLVTVEVRRDASRSPGFSLGVNAAGRPVLASVDGAGSADGSGAAAEGITSPTAIDPTSSVVPVPVRHILRPGDELVEVNAVRTATLTIGGVVSLVRGARDPLTLRLARPRVTTAAGSKMHDLAGASGTTGAESRPAGPAIAPDQYVRQVAWAVGPWGMGAYARHVPAPPVTILGVSLTGLPHVAALLPGGCCAGTPPAHDPALPAPDHIARALYVVVRAGPGCNTVVFDSRLHGPPDITTAAASAAGSLPRGPSSAAPATTDGTGIELTAAGRIGAGKSDAASVAVAAPAAESLPGSGSDSATAGAPSHALQRLLSGAALGWRAGFAAEPVVVEGDVRVCLHLEGRRKPIAEAWAHTAFLPLPDAVRPLVEAVWAREPAGECTRCVYVRPLFPSTLPPPDLTPSLDH